MRRLAPTQKPKQRSRFLFEILSESLFFLTNIRKKLPQLRSYAIQLGKLAHF
jgi:hypothetical protein